MPRATSLHALYEGWADQHRRLLDTLRPLSPAQMRLRPAPSEWAIWQLASNMAGGRLYWLCHMLGEDDRGLSGMFKVDHASLPGIDLAWAGWEDNEDQPRTADELIDALEKTWQVAEAAVDHWTELDLHRPVACTDAWGQPRTITPAEVVWRLASHEVHHGSEISLILRVHGLSTQINR